MNVTCRTFSLPFQKRLGRSLDSLKNCSFNFTSRFLFQAQTETPFHSRVASSPTSPQSCFVDGGSHAALASSTSGDVASLESVLHACNVRIKQLAWIMSLSVRQHGQLRFKVWCIGVEVSSKTASYIECLVPKLGLLRQQRLSLLLSLVACNPF